MTPDRTTEWILQYASRVSPLWLLLALPAGMAAAWWLYGKERRATTGAHAMLLPTLRCGLAAMLVFLAFRPSLIWREITTWPGRVILLADDSESMAPRDTSMPAEEAVLLYRQIHGDVAGAPQQFHDMAAEVRGLIRLVYRLRPLSAGGDRQRDEFWDQAEAIQSRIDETFDVILDAGSETAGLPDALREKANESVSLLKGIRQRCRSLLTGDRHPGNEAFDSVADALRDTADTLLRLQAAADREADADAAGSLQRAADEIRNTPRIDLLAAALEQAADALPDVLPGQNFQVVRLMGGRHSELTGFSADDLQPVHGETRIADRLLALLSDYGSDEEDKFPITTIVLLGDGRDLSGTTVQTVSQAATREHVPISGGAVGSVNEPSDVAVLDVVAPPYAVQGTTLRVCVRLKVALPQPGEIQVQLKHGTKVLAEETVSPSPREAALPGSEKQRSTDGYDIVETVLAFTPQTAGRFRYTVEVASVPGEIFPRRNNAEDLVVQVRPETIRILLVDWKPRWETRFALNILRRLDYVELNDIIVIVSEDGNLPRGAVKGTWPQDDATLALYDVVVLGALPSDVLTEEEWDLLRRLVEEDGKTLLLLASGPGTLDALDMRPYVEPPEASRSRNREISGPAVTQTARSLVTSATVHVDLSKICVTQAGSSQPLTRALGRVVSSNGEVEIATLHAQLQPLLLAAPGKGPVVATRYKGAGKIAYLGTDQFWKRFNPTALDAHAALYVNSVSWAVEGDSPVPDRTAPQLLLDTPWTTTREAFQAWVVHPSEDARLEAVSEGEVVATVPVEPVHPASVLGRAVFPSLPAGEVEIRMAAAPDVEPRHVEVLERYPELHFLARDDALLTSLAADTGGRYGSFTDLATLICGVEPKSRIEKQESIYRLWDARIVFAFILLGLTVEWVWRKLAGLI